MEGIIYRCPVCGQTSDKPSMHAHWVRKENGRINYRKKFEVKFVAHIEPEKRVLT